LRVPNFLFRAGRDMPAHGSMIQRWPEAGQLPTSECTASTACVTSCRTK
jgi:hypothetical protein